MSVYSHACGEHEMTREHKTYVAFRKETIRLSGYADNKRRLVYALDILNKIWRETGESGEKIKEIISE